MPNRSAAHDIVHITEGRRRSYTNHCPGTCADPEILKYLLKNTTWAVRGLIDGCLRFCGCSRPVALLLTFRCKRRRTPNMNARDASNDHVMRAHNTLIAPTRFARYVRMQFSSLTSPRNLASQKVVVSRSFDCGSKRNRHRFFITSVLFLSHNVLETNHSLVGQRKLYKDCTYLRS
jgi:hypothetical protein